MTPYSEVHNVASLVVYRFAGLFNRSTVYSGSANKTEIKTVNIFFI